MMLVLESSIQAERIDGNGNDYRGDLEKDQPPALLLVFYDG